MTAKAASWLSVFVKLFLSDCMSRSVAACYVIQCEAGLCYAELYDASSCYGVLSEVDCYWVSSPLLNKKMLPSLVSLLRRN